MVPTMSDVPFSPFTLELRAWMQAGEGGARPWSEVMERALYDPLHGYYGAGPRRLGRDGDFYTAVTVGALYGQLLAEVVIERWTALGKPDDFTMVEQGAHDGQLMADISAVLPPQIQLCIHEARLNFRAAQHARLGHRVQWIGAWDELRSANVMVVCNELHDALPVRRVRRIAAGWEEAHVRCNDAGFDWCWQPASVALSNSLPIGYTTELHDSANAWMREVAALPNVQAMLIADYGHEAEAYYQPERAEGTLRRYWQHKSDTEVLCELGACDLTAHVNFTGLIDHALGFKVQRFMEQGRFLTHAATRWLHSLEGRAQDAATQALLRQFHTLTHPGHMGAAFKLLLLQRDL